MLLTDNLCRGGGGGGGRRNPSNNTPTGHRKMWKNMKSWFENFHENLVPPPICTSFRLMPLSLEACFKKMFPPKWKGKKKGVGAWKPKSQGITFEPQNNQFFLLSTHELQKLFVRTLDSAELDWYTRFWAVLVFLARWSENDFTTCGQSDGVLF